MLRTVQAFVERHNLLPPGQTVVVGVSGGPDSLCLLHLLRRLAAPYALTLQVAHLHHGWRGEAADEDAVFVGKLAAAWGLDCSVAVVDVPQLARQQGLSPEEAARRVRYRFLAEVAGRVGAGTVAVGHNADDQSETVLMHLIRGSGLAGLRGMPPAVDLGRLGLHVEPWKRNQPPLPAPGPRLIRPLLAVPRAEVETYCQAHRLNPRFDRSNLDTTLFRNRLRHELLPTLEGYNPNVRQGLRRLASVVRADYELLRAATKDAWAQTVRRESDQEIAFDLAQWRGLPLSLQRSTLRQAAYQLRPHLRDVDFVHLDQAVRVATGGETGAQATLPQGLMLTLGYQNLRLADAGQPPPPPDWPHLNLEPGKRLPVPLPGQTPLPGGAWCLQTIYLETWDETVFRNPDPWTAYLDAAKLASPLALRGRRPGDRFRPLGMAGHSVEVADLMVNLKIPQPWRDQVPLLVHQTARGEQILWVAGWRLAEGAKIGLETERVARLRFRPSE